LEHVRGEVGVAGADRAAANHADVVHRCRAAAGSAAVHRRIAVRPAHPGLCVRRVRDARDDACVLFPPDLRWDGSILYSYLLFLFYVACESVLPPFGYSDLQCACVTLYAKGSVQWNGSES